MNSAAVLAARQAHYDRLHHLMRLEWLRAPAPAWSCGTPIAEHDVLNLTTQSERAIASTMEGYNSVDLNDAQYLAELDAFAARDTVHA